MNKRRFGNGIKTGLGLMAVAQLLFFSLTLQPPQIFADDPADRVEMLLDNGSSGGTIGLYLKEVGGPVIASLNEDFIFEPASTIKVGHHLNAMLKVQNDPNFDLTTPINWFQNMTGSCPVDSIPATDPLETGLTAMMVPSDNRWTQAFRVLLGEGNINDMMQNDLGMTNSLIQHRIGCGADAVANHNQLTLEDAGKLYEAVSNGFLNPSNRTKFYDIMDQFNGEITPIINDEVMSLGLSPGALAQFNALRNSALKAGSYTLSDGLYRSVAGWAEIPFKDANCELSPREYVLGAFVDAADSLTPGFSIRDTGVELLREQYRAALESWAECEADLRITSTVVVNPPSEIDVNTPVDIVVRTAVQNAGPASVVDGELNRIATAPPDCTVSPLLDNESVLGMNEGAVIPLEKTFTIECSESSEHTFIFESQIMPLNPNVNDPDLGNNDAFTNLTVAVIAQADLAVVSWDFSALDGAGIDDLLVGQPFFFPTNKTLHNFGDTVTNLYSNPVDANVRKTMIIPEGIKGSVHVSADEAPATIIIEKQGEPPEQLDNQPASTIVEVEGPAELSVQFMVMDLEVSINRMISEEFDVECLEPSMHEIKFVNEIMPKDPHVEDPDPSNNTMEVTKIIECVTPVQINVRPGNPHNFINPNDKKNLPVAILTTDAGEYGLPVDFDATTVDPLSVRFGTKEVLEMGGGAVASPAKGFVKDSKELDDKTKDGDSDMELHIKITGAGFDQTTTEACLTGLYLGEDNNFHTFFGCDSVQIIP